MMGALAGARSQMQALAEERQSGIGRNDVDVAGLNRDAIVNLHHRHRSLLGQQLRQQTVMSGIQVLDDHVRHVALARQGRQ